MWSGGVQNSTISRGTKIPKLVLLGSVSICIVHIPILSAVGLKPYSYASISTIYYQFQTSRLLETFASNSDSFPATFIRTAI
jgi:hypothetical protein